MLRHLDPTKIERHGETHILDFLRAVSKLIRSISVTIRGGYLRCTGQYVEQLPAATPAEQAGIAVLVETILAAEAAVDARVAALYGVALPGKVLPAAGGAEAAQA